MNITNRANTNKDFPRMNGWSLKLLSTTILACMASSVGHTSDLEIYQGATYGNASITMMIDNSGSMGPTSMKDDYGISTNVSSNPRVWYCESGRRNAMKIEKISQIIYDDAGKATADKIEYGIEYCQIGSKVYETRMTRLKKALIPLFANPKSDIGFGKDVDLSKYKIGLGTFYFKSSDDGGGQIVTPVLDMTLVNRKKLLNEVVKITANTNTPTAKAYAEAGAYMLGTTTGNSVNEKRYTELGYRIKFSDGYFSLYQCKNGNKAQYETNTRFNIKVYKCEGYEVINGQNRVVSQRDIDESKLGFSDEAYNTESGTERYYLRSGQSWPDDSSPSGGFSLSSSTTKTANQSKYQSPVRSDSTQCDGYGVYFLTDGEPNNSFSESDTIGLMNKTLVGGGTSIGATCSSGLTSDGSLFKSNKNNGEPAWECIGEYSKALYNKNNVQGVPIATATVGFGAPFKEINEQAKISKTITLPSGVREVIDVYDCDSASITSQDAKNVCKLGEKGQGYGEGGFFYATESKDIADSIKKFIEDVSTAEIEPISAGTMAVPLDSLGGLTSRQFAYLPILEPIPNSPRLWKGNLKKYKVRNATLLGSDNKFVFKDKAGLFATDTHDLWNNIIDDTRPDTLRPDLGLPQIGGAYQKIFENATVNVGDRNLFVDNSGSLTNLKVNATNNKPVNFTTLAGYTNPQKLALLSFMGYSEPNTTTVADDIALVATQNKRLKNIGGVLHSIPQLITKKVAVDAAGRFDTSKREDYILYGSMDGALHMVDDSTGKETFTFIPKQILDLQPDALADKGTAKDGSYPYGVDAPWRTYVSYTTKSTTTGEGEAATTVNSYEADQSFALGGLRMGGSMYYALDVSNVNTPKIIYGVGSNYANRLAGDTAALGGTKDNVTGSATAEQKAFAKMGQSWGKPALGYVKSGGKRVMVSFLPGGYDTCYEDPKFNLNTSYPNDTKCNNKSEAQGNGVYMVQMGEVKTKTNNEETVDTTKNNGKLLWWASNNGNGSNSTSRSNSLQYSRAADLKHSVVTQVRTLDRNYDGLVDHIYFADLGGQVWRADINNNADTDNFKVDRVVKVLDVSDQVGTGDAPPRIYERPLITFYNGKFGYTDAANKSGSASGVQAMITVGTGDRSNPVTATRNVPDALYSVIDKDVARSDLFYYKTGTAPTISLRTPINKVAGTSTRNDKLQKLTFSAADIATGAGGAAAKPGIKENMQSGAIQGWYMPFDTWLNETKQATGPYRIKMFNEPDALAGILVSSSYNPDEGQEIQACSAGVIGETQRERTCLPYGVCLDGAGNGILTTRATFNAGSGIVDNIVTQFNDTSIFSALVNRCEGDDCTPKVICPSGDCDNVPPPCTGPGCGPLDGLITDKRINPLSWIEH